MESLHSIKKTISKVYDRYIDLIENGPQYNIGDVYLLKDVLTGIGDNFTPDDWIFEPILANVQELPLSESRLEYISLLEILSDIETNFNNHAADFVDRNVDLINAAISAYKNHCTLRLLARDVTRIYMNTVLNNKKYNASIYVNLLKKYRYKQSIYDHLIQFISDDDRINLENDYYYNFEAYLRQVYKYYYEFYTRSTTVDSEVASRLLKLTADPLLFKGVDISLVEDCVKESGFNLDDEIKKSLSKSTDKKLIEDTINRLGIKYSASLEFTYRLHLGIPLEHQLESIDNFTNNLRKYVSTVYKGMEDQFKDADPLLLPQLDYIRSTSGCIINKDDMDKIFSRWQRYLEIYDMRSNKGYSWTQVRDAVNKSISGAFKKEVATVTNEYDEAVRLIESAAKGKFPY